MASSAMARGSSGSRPAQAGLPASLSSTSAVVFSSLDRLRADSLGPTDANRETRPAGQHRVSPGGFNWEHAGTLSNARSRLGMAFFPGNGRFYVLGGESTAGNRAIPIEEYNPATNTWADKSMLSPGVSNTGAARVGNYIYVPGGFDGVSGLTSMQRYDPVANTVTAMAPMPAGNFANAVAAQGTKVYVLGGSSTGAAGTTNMIYDTATNTWSTGAPLPTAVQYPAAASDGTYLYAIGGYTPDMNILQPYGPDANTWTARATMGAARGGPAAFFDGSQVWAVAGGWTTYLTGTGSYKPAQK